MEVFFLPFPDILPYNGPGVGALTVLFTVLEFPDILPSIGVS